MCVCAFVNGGECFLCIWCDEIKMESESPTCTMCTHGLLLKSGMNDSHAMHTRVYAYHDFEMGADDSVYGN